MLGVTAIPHDHCGEGKKCFREDEGFTCKDQNTTGKFTFGANFEEYRLGCKKA